MLNVYDLVGLLTVNRAPPIEGWREEREVDKWLNLINTSIAVECPLWERESEGERLPDTFPYSVFVWGTPNCRYSTHYIYPLICIYIRVISVVVVGSVSINQLASKFMTSNIITTTVCLCICVCLCGEAFHALIISWRRNSLGGCLPFYLPPFLFSLPLFFLFTNYVCFSYWPRLAFFSFLFQLFSSTNLCKQFSVSMRRIPLPHFPSFRLRNHIIKKPSFFPSSASSSWGRLQRSNGNAKTQNYTQIWIAWRSRRQSLRKFAKIQSGNDIIWY